MRCQERHDQLQDLSAGTLDEPATSDLLDHVEVCEDCSAHLDLLADVVQAVQAEPEAAATVPPATQRAPRRRPSVAVVLVTLVIGAAWLSLGDDPVSLASLADRSIPRYLPGTPRSEEQWRRFDEAMAPYQAHDFAAAVVTLDEFLETDPAHGPARFYRGIALVQRGDHAAAARDLTVAAGSPHRALADDAIWRLASLALLQNDEVVARGHLRALARPDDDREGAYRQAAIELLDRLDRRR